MQELHREIVRRLVLGQRPREIAAELGVTPQTVSNVRNSSVVRQYMEMLQQGRDADVVAVQRRIKELAAVAIDVLEEAMEDESTPMGVRVRAAIDVLDRGGHAAPKRVEFLHGVFTRKDLEELKQRAIAAGAVIPANDADEVGEEVEDASFREVSADRDSDHSSRAA